MESTVVQDTTNDSSNAAGNITPLLFGKDNDDIVNVDGGLFGSGGGVLFADLDVDYNGGSIVATSDNGVVSTNVVSNGSVSAGGGDDEGGGGGGGGRTSRISKADQLMCGLLLGDGEHDPLFGTDNAPATHGNKGVPLPPQSMVMATPAPSSSPPSSRPSSLPLPPPGLVTSKLSASGLLESAASGNVEEGGLFDNDNDGGGEGLFHDIDEGGGGGLFDNIEDTLGESCTSMHDLNLNDCGGVSGDFRGIGMGLGEIPLSSHQAPPHPIFASYRPPSPEKPQQHPYQQQYPPPPQQHQQQGVMNTMAGSYYYSTTGSGQMTQQGIMRSPPPSMPRQGQGQGGQQQWNHPDSPKQQPPSVLGHVDNVVHLGDVAPNSMTTTRTIPPPASLGGPSSYGHYGRMGSDIYGNNNFLPPPADYVPYPPFDPLYGRVAVTDPMLIQGTGLFAGPPHWTYLVTVYSKNSAITRLQQQPSNEPLQQQRQQSQELPISAVRRRFRHFVALEDRLRQSVPGAILPPRPEKHPGRAIEEAAARQSSDFAQQRSRELGAYMNALVAHPHVGSSPELKLFLLLQDHIGTAWPEVSSSAFTRMTAVVTTTAESLTEKVDGVLSELGTAQQVAAGEDSAEILALAAFEGRRIGAVTSSVPKVEGAVSLMRDRGDRLGSTGLEMSKLAKDVGWCDRDLAAPMEVLSGALLRCGRRTKRLGLELGAAITPFVVQHRTCRYEQLAFADRRACLKRRTEARMKADGRAAKLMMNQSVMQSVGRLGSLERMETEAAMYDEFAMEASKEADEVATRLQQEVGRIRAIRVREWDASMKVIASGMKESYAENVNIWESALEAFKREFPDCLDITSIGVR